MTTETKALTLTSMFESALELVKRVTLIKTITTPEQFVAANEYYKSIIDHEKELELQYNALDCVIQAKRAQAQKKELATKFEQAKKYLKNGPMLDFEQAEERKRQAEEARLAEIARKEAEAETARLVAEQKKAFEKAERERKAAEALAAKLKEGEAKAAALSNAKLAAARAEQAKLEAQAIRADAAAAPTPVVVVEKTAPTVTRRKVYKFEVRNPELVPKEYLMVDEIKIGKVVRALGEATAIPGVVVYSEQV